MSAHLKYESALVFFIPASVDLISDFFLGNTDAALKLARDWWISYIRMDWESKKIGRAAF